MSDATPRWVDATPGVAPAREEVLTPEQVASWRERGFALVDGVPPGELLERARSGALRTAGHGRGVLRGGAPPRV